MVKALDISEFMRPSQDLSRSGSYRRGNFQMRSYQVAKLALTAWIFSLARRWAGRGVTANVLTLEWSRASSASSSKVRSGPLA
jgi:NAD(P)-dependent dehydrogenase (short-subunit alcohol dehydrogenase family)